MWVVLMLGTPLAACQVELILLFLDKFFLIMFTEQFREKQLNFYIINVIYNSALTGWVSFSIIFKGKRWPYFTWRNSQLYAKYLHRCLEAVHQQRPFWNSAPSSHHSDSEWGSSALELETDLHEHHPKSHPRKETVMSDLYIYRERETTRPRQRKKEGQGAQKKVCEVEKRSEKEKEYIVVVHFLCS